ncbi:MAG: M23 family metallopeptidase [Anaerolineales bacterium]
MKAIKLDGDVHRSRAELRWWPLLAAVAMLAAGLACARGDVPVNAAGVTLPPATQSKATETTAPIESVTPMQSSTPVPTDTPSAPEVPVSPTPPPTPTSANGDEPTTILYQVQPADTLRTLAVRFGVVIDEITPAEGTLPGPDQMLTPDRLLLIPRRLGPTGPSEKLIPDSEFVFSPHAVDFDPASFANQQGGYLSQYRETVYGRWRTGPEVVELAARDNSVNPRLLMAMLEFISGWLTSPDRPVGGAFTYPLGHKDPETQGMYRQLTWLANKMGEGYYGWRAGKLTELGFGDGSTLRLAPGLNAGTVALQYYFSTELSSRQWAEAISPSGFAATYESLFGDPFEYTHPLFEAGVSQPTLILPFIAGHSWAFTGGPHGAWEREAAWAALDFAPPSVEAGCAKSDEWVVASAAGLVLRSGRGLVVLDLDGDGREQTGWDLIYLHIAEVGSVEAGDFVEQGDLIGHPSCEGGIATGTHVHMARKYNGEWILADGALPFNLSGWVSQAGTKPYQGALVKGDQVVLACTCASSETYISR